MNMKIYLVRILLLFTLLLSCIDTYAQRTHAIDTCTVNDLCETATAFPQIDTDSSSVCLSGCLLNALPEIHSTICGMDTVPTVWYKVVTDHRANLINIRIQLTSSEGYSLSLFKVSSDCNALEPVSLWINSFCRNSFGQRIDVAGIPVDSLSTYMIAVTSADQSGDEFSICVSLNRDRIPCLLIGDIVITERSSGQEDDAPYLPGEEVGICMVVNEFQTGGFNGCQWFQGLIPYFGTAWDPSSFDGNGQPLGATVNDLLIGETANGLYGPSTWDWFSDIGYHSTNDTLQIGDIDGNSTLDLCSTMYEDCLDFGGVTGGCCPACWEDSGQILPPGWFAYGINGSCAQSGHPTVDWGDGNSCYGSMGPWYF